VWLACSGVQARRGKETREFFSMRAFHAWQRTDEWLNNSWRLKYYKGLGTNTSDEGKEYFSKLPLHRKTFVWSGRQDAEAINMAFAKDQVRLVPFVAQTTTGTTTLSCRTASLRCTCCSAWCHP
jgi:hypothetical protein